jgi:hypothetical protein
MILALFRARDGARVRVRLRVRLSVTIRDVVRVWDRFRRASTLHKALLIPTEDNRVMVRVRVRVRVRVTMISLILISHS